MSAAFKKCFSLSQMVLLAFRDACLNIYPKADHQTCWVYIQRNIAKLVRAKDRKEIMDAIKPLYRSSNLEAARLEFKKLKDSIGKVYPKVIKLLESNESLF